MEGLHGNTKNSTKASKFKSLNVNISPLNLNAQSFIGRGINHHQQKSPIFDPYASSDSCSDSPNLDSPLIRYLYWSSGSCGGSESRAGGRSGGGFFSPFPLASIENFQTPPLRSTTLKVEEDVLVMDGILVDSDKSNNPKACGSARIRSSLTSSDSKGRSSSCTSSGGSENSFYKLEKCRSWEDSGTCRFGSKCHFAHGKEELRPLHLLGKNKSEEKLCKTFGSGSCIYGANCRFVHHQVKSPHSSIEPASTAKALPTSGAKISPSTQENSTSTRNNMTTTALTVNDWSPLDDAIAMALPLPSSEETPSKEDVHAEIHNVLFGPSVRERLPVFTEFCCE